MTLVFDQGDMTSQNKEVEQAYCLSRFTKHLHLVEQMCDGKCKSIMKVNKIFMEIHSNFVAQGILVKMQCIRNW